MKNNIAKSFLLVLFLSISVFQLQASSPHLTGTDEVRPVPMVETVEQGTRFKMQLAPGITGDIEVDILDLDNNLIQHSVTHIDAPETTLEFIVNDLPKGFYKIKVADGTNLQQKNIVID